MNNSRRRGSYQRLIAELAELLPVPAERDLPAGRQETLKEHLMSELRQADHSEVRRERAGRRRPLPALTATVAAAAIAVTGLTMIALSGHHGAPAAGHHQAGQVTAAQLLGKIAAAAARQPQLNVHDDQYMYVASEDRWSSTFVTSGGDQTAVDPLHKREIWLSVSDVCKPGLLKDPSPGPATKLSGGGSSCPSQGGWGDPTYRFLQHLPTDPRTLLNMIYTATKGQGQSPDQEAFTTIGDMLREAIAPPGVSAALYRAAALIPGVRVIARATDILGQPGIGVQFARRVIQSPAPGVPYRETFDPDGLTWIFNPSTLVWMGENDGSVQGKPLGSVVLKRAIVDQLGQLPAGE